MFQIKCVQHNDELISSLNMAKYIKDEERLLCKSCPVKEGYVVDLERCFRYHSNLHNMIKNRLLFESYTFHQIVRKNLTKITERLQFMKDQLVQLNQELDIVYQQFKENINKKDYLFQLNTFEQAKIFAKEHFETFYEFAENNREQEIYSISLQDKFQNETNQSKLIIQELYSNKMQMVKADVATLQFDFIEIDNIVQSNTLQDLIKKATAINLHDFSTINDISFMQFDQAEQNLIFKQGDEIGLCEVPKNRNCFRLLGKQKVQIMACKAFSQNQKFDWLVCTNKSLNEHQLTFYNIKYSENQFQFIDQYQIQIKKEVKQLEIDQSHDACFSFCQDEFIIWQHKERWQGPISHGQTSFKKATFNQSNSYLLVQQDSTNKILLYNTEDIKRINNPIEITLPISDGEDFSVFFLQNKLIQVLISQKGRIQIGEIQPRIKGFTLLQQFTIQQGNLSFCPISNQLAVINVEQEILYFYALKYGEKVITISLFSQIVLQNGTFVKTQFSSKGKFISVATSVKRSVEDINSIPQLQIFLVKNLPRTNVLQTQNQQK